MRRGRNISNENLKEIFDFLQSFEPENDIQKRDKIILEYAYIQNMSSHDIAALHDARIVGIGNHGKGKPLTENSICRIIKGYGLVHEKKYDYTTRNNYNRRKTIRNKVNKKEYNHPRQCSMCGCTEHLEFHHIIPLEDGGTDAPANMIYLCHNHHRRVHLLWKGYKRMQNAIPFDLENEGMTHM